MVLIYYIYYNLLNIKIALACLICWSINCLINSLKNNLKKEEVIINIVLLLILIIIIPPLSIKSIFKSKKNNKV